MAQISDLAYRDLHVSSRDIPHLDLGLRFDVDKMMKEYVDLPRGIIKPYFSNTDNEYMRDRIANSWHGAAFVSPTGSVHDGLSEMPREATQLRYTPLCDMCPYMMQVMRSFESGFPGVMRVMTVQAGGSLTWHSHYFDYPKYDHGKVTVHVPIVMPAKFRYSVIDVNKYRLADHTTEKFEVFNARYPEGHGYLFNNYHMHNVFNHDDYGRVSIMMYLDLKNAGFADIVREAVRKYNGPMVR